MSILQKLGLSENSKVLIIHADDAGLSHSENQATIKAINEGMVNSYSIMTSCPWFLEIAEYAKMNPEIDYGIHLTLTCEWEKYRFGPVLPVSKVPSLVDENGHFHKTREQIKKEASASEIELELTAQIEKALKLGLSPTHLDSHMYTIALRTDIFEIYKKLGTKYKLPIFLNKKLLEKRGLDTNLCITKDNFLINHLHIGEYDFFKDDKLWQYYEEVLDDIQPGFNLLLLHTAFDDREMQGITVNHPNFGAKWRQIDFDFITSAACKSKLKENNIILVTWNDIKKVLY